MFGHIRRWIGFSQVVLQKILYLPYHLLCIVMMLRLAAAVGIGCGFVMYFFFGLLEVYVVDLGVNPILAGLLWGAATFLYWLGVLAHAYFVKGEEHF